MRRREGCLPWQRSCYLKDVILLTASDGRTTYHITFSTLWLNSKEVTMDCQATQLSYVHTYIHTYTYTYIHTYIYVYVLHTYIYVYVHTCIHIRTRTYMYIHTYIYVRIHTYIRTYVCTYILTIVVTAVTMYWQCKNYTWVWLHAHAPPAQPNTTRVIAGYHFILLTRHITRWGTVTCSRWAPSKGCLFIIRCTYICNGTYIRTVYMLCVSTTRSTLWVKHGRDRSGKHPHKYLQLEYFATVDSFRRSFM